MMQLLNQLLDIPAEVYKRTVIHELYPSVGFDNERLTPSWLWKYKNREVLLEVFTGKAKLHFCVDEEELSIFDGPVEKMPDMIVQYLEGA